ncbi:hypothetical protein CK203_090600 [Vitis vinifera]|uniref:Small acidic protein-like domain-containing protein n=1 Tax=Vitis vinifera TaxID=29760 RepID=A0A438DKD6_VITVI|nr:hypothetical protein CK203_090600 [Vitis vinifera]
MDSSLKSPPRDKADAKTAFRKPTNDATNRKYRRRSPTSGSSSSGGSPIHEHNSSPIFSKEDSEKVSDRRQRRKGDGRELDRDAGRSQYRKTADSYRHSDRQSSRSSRGHYRYDDHVRQEKHAADEGDRDHHNLSSRSGRESRVGYRSKDKEKETSSLEHQKYKDKDLSSDRAGSGRRHTNSNFEDSKAGEQDKHLRDGDGPDERKDYRRGLGDYKSDRLISHEESRGIEMTQLQEGTVVDIAQKKFIKMNLRKWMVKNSPKMKRRNMMNGKLTGTRTDTTENLGSSLKIKLLLQVKIKSLQPKAKAVSRFSTAVADMKQSSSSKLAQDIADKVTPEHAFLNNFEVANDLNAAKIAAMKAAELVNRNLVGVGYMSADQKKKLLWGSKKSTTAEESGHHWDTALFSDRERQEKFNKLMGVKGEVKVEHKPDNQDAEKQRELQMDLEKQYTAGLRRRDGRTVGLVSELDKECDIVGLLCLANLKLGLPRDQSWKGTCWAWVGLGWCIKWLCLLDVSVHASGLATVSFVFRRQRHAAVMLQTSTCRAWASISQKLLLWIVLA